MINKPDDLQTASHRARRYVRGIVVAVTLTVAALLFLYATLYGESSEGALARPTPETGFVSAPVETGSTSTSGITTVDAR